jgi:uncharacterized iron-regulated membrane protein
MMLLLLLLLLMMLMMTLCWCAVVGVRVTAARPSSRWGPPRPQA